MYDIYKFKIETSSKSDMDKIENEIDKDKSLNNKDKIKLNRMILMKGYENINVVKFKNILNLVSACESAPTEDKLNTSTDADTQKVVENVVDRLLPLYKGFSFVELLTGKQFTTKYKTIDELPLPTLEIIEVVFKEADVRNVLVDCVIIAINGMDETLSTIDDDRSSKIGEVIKAAATKLMQAYNKDHSEFNASNIEMVEAHEWYNALKHSIYEDDIFNSMVKYAMSKTEVNHEVVSQ